MNERMTLSVTQLNEYIKMLLDGSPILSDICVKGEISNFVNHRTGHFYFSLKDEGGVVRAVMFKGSAAKLKLQRTLSPFTAQAHLRAARSIRLTTTE